MTWTAEWRTKGGSFDAVFVRDDEGTVREAFPASQPVLSRLLTEMGDLRSWTGESSLDGYEPGSEAWGSLVIARSGTGEVIEVEPELFWQGIYLWFRSRGVDYDTPGLRGDLPVNALPKLRLSVLMDD